MDFEQASLALRGERFPCAAVDLDAFERNIDRARKRAAAAGKQFRVASKSVRHLGLLRRIVERGGSSSCGVLCFTGSEANWLAERGMDDLLVAYPELNAAVLRQSAAWVSRGKVIRFVVDAPEHVTAIADAAGEVGCEIGVVLEQDVAYRAFGLHLGARRSPLRTPSQLLELFALTRRVDGVRCCGLMAYEAHLAGLPDQTPNQPALSRARQAFKRLAGPAVRAMRQQAVEALRRAGAELELINGGGTGSLASTAADPSVTEVAIGSGFLCSELFRHYRDNPFEPALHIALSVCRRPAPHVMTCLGGGYAASGAPGWDRLPLPVWPEGLHYLEAEGAGEVQTPMAGSAATRAQIGDLVWVRPAKAGEIAERFADYVLLRGGRRVGHEPTYRGQGECFL